MHFTSDYIKHLNILNHTGMIFVVPLVHCRSCNCYAEGSSTYNKSVMIVNEIPYRVSSGNPQHPIPYCESMQISFLALWKKLLNECTSSHIYNCKGPKLCKNSNYLFSHRFAVTVLFFLHRVKLSIWSAHQFQSNGPLHKISWHWGGDYGNICFNLIIFRIFSWKMTKFCLEWDLRMNLVIFRITLYFFSEKVVYNFSNNTSEPLLKAEVQICDRSPILYYTVQQSRGIGRMKDLIYIKNYDGRNSLT